ncbi:unnamed protein product [Hydatigera taeniaeformis]|uniref:Guanylate cyclase n=1 Tax=Hydatigena taeniaeformis TaxID=6205 RepID=A0A0R3WKY0_HYDTA|nr:unnamed protein product [Hydatigera taeniaeformis]
MVEGASQAGLDYVFANFVGIWLASTVIFVLYAAFKRNQPWLPANQAILPALLSGVLWGVAQSSWFIANAALGEPITFPVVTTCPAVIATLVGVIIFKEIKGRQRRLLTYKLHFLHSPADAFNALAMLQLALLILLATLSVYNADAKMPSERYLLTIYTLIADPNCSLDLMAIYNFTHSVAAAARFVRSLMPANSDTFFFVVLEYVWVPGCSMHQAKRKGAIFQILQSIQKNASTSVGFSVLLGPPYSSDCNLVNEWINIGNPNAVQRAQLYQIGYHCQILSSTSVFDTYLTNNAPRTLPPPIAAVSSVVQRKTILQGILVYLINNGWIRIAVFYDMHATVLDLPEMLDSTLSTLRLSSSKHHVLDLLTSVGFTAAANFSSLVEPLQDQMDVALVLARADLAVKFVVSIQNLTCIKQGRIAMLHLDPMDMLTYDVLREWRLQLLQAEATWAAGRSLIIVTALPKGTRYEEDSVLYREPINLSVAGGAALAMRLVQLHLEEGRGKIDPSTALFRPLRTSSSIQVPTLPSITFHYQLGDGDVSYGIFDLLLFALKPNATEVSGVEAQAMRCADIFYLVDVIHYPLILPQPRSPMNWPGDGQGPQRTAYLSQPLAFESLQAILFINAFGLLISGLIYLGVVLVFRRIVRKTKRFASFKLIFLQSDFLFKDDDDNLRAEQCHEPHRNLQLQVDVVSTSDVVNSYHALLSTPRVSITASSISEEPLRRVRKGRIAILNGAQVYVKELGLSRILLRSRLIEHLAGLRQLRHENINVFVGCCVTPDTLNLVYDYCQRGSLQDVINNKSITFDWDFKLSLMTDLVRGMEYLHSTSLKAHGRLKSTNCVVSSRYALRITDYGIQKTYNLVDSCPSDKPEDKLWTAPELLRDETADLHGTKPGDVYAFAIIMHEVFYQTIPYGPGETPVEELLQRVMGKERPPFRPQLLEAGVPQAYRNILQRAWSENPELRPTFKELNEEIERMASGKKTNIVEHMFKMMENYSSRLEEEVKLRTDELEKEKRKKELLICRLLPPVVAEALKAGVAVAPETYNEVSIYISDIIGFTTISAMSTPLQVVDFLNDLYTMFDRIIAHYDVYKVETIGDAYMVTSGLPVRNGRRHAAEVATMSLDLLSSCGTFTIKHLPQIPLRLRIGLHSGEWNASTASFLAYVVHGPCVAGVVGLTMPRYCLFGDTVNRALKMESSGAEESVTGELYSRRYLSVSPHFVTRPTGSTHTNCLGESLWQNFSPTPNKAPPLRLTHSVAAKCLVINLASVYPEGTRWLHALSPHQNNNSDPQTALHCRAEQ